MSDLQQNVSNELFYLKWSNFQVNVSSEFKKIQEAADLVDITFSCDGKQFGAHKLVLFACSPYFKEVLKKNPCSHPVFFINGVKSEVLRAILDFMYMGEVHINNEDLIEFIEMAEQFKIRGVTKENSDSNISNIRRHDASLEKQRKHKRLRLDGLTGETSTDDGIIEPKSEIEFGEQSCQTTQHGGDFGSGNVDYEKAHQRMSYDSAGPSSVPQHGDEWLDDKNFMTSNNSSNTNASNTTSGSNEDADQQRCKTKNYKALEPCSCPLCARVYSNVSNLRQHMRLIHNPTSVCCPLCQKSFTSDLYLKRHYLSMHGGSVPAQSATGSQQNNPNSSQAQLQAPHNSTQQQSQPPQQSSQTQQQVPHTVDPKHVNPANMPFHLYATTATTKREYTDLHANASQVATNTLTVDGKQTQQMTQWGYDSNKVE